jgi:5-methylthioadenosine/S-adenosylhomocysteine deaminase
MTESNQPTDIVIAGGIVLTMDPKRHVYASGSVAIKDETIVAVGRKITGSASKKTIDARNCIVLPGLINTHTHAAMVYFRGLADDLPLQTWLARYIWPTEARYVRGPMVHDATELAALEMIKSGTTLFNDMYFFEDEAARSAKKIGIRAMLGKALFTFPGPDGKSPHARLRSAEKFVETWRADPLVRPAIAPHAPYTCSADLLRETKKLADAYTIPYHIHLAESKNEVEESKKRHGLTPPAYLEKLGVLGSTVVAVHCCWLTDDDIRLLKEYDVAIAHCPQSNMKLASGVAPVAKLLALGIQVGLGTDGAASNNNLDMVEEMDSAAKLQKITTGDPTVLRAKEVVAMATIGGAQVLGLERELGSLEPGKKADIIIIDLNKPHLTPLYDPYSHLVYAANGSDVKTVIVNGKIIMENYEILTTDEEAIMAKAKKFSARIRK